MGILFATRTSDTPPKPLLFSLVRWTRWEDDFTLSKDDGTPVDLTGITRLWMRVRARPLGPILLELTDAVDNGRLVITNAATGAVGIRVESADTGTFPLAGGKKAKYFYDVVIERSPGEYEPGISGKIAVYPQITNPQAAT